MALADPPPLPLSTTADGTICVGGTRVTLDTVIGAYLDGAIPEEIVLQYDSLHVADVYAVIGYYLHNRAELDAYLEQRQQAAQAIRRDNETRSPAAGLRERRLARPR